MFSQYTETLYFIYFIFVFYLHVSFGHISYFVGSHNKVVLVTEDINLINKCTACEIMASEFLKLRVGSSSQVSRKKLIVDSPRNLVKKVTNYFVIIFCYTVFLSIIYVLYDLIANKFSNTLHKIYWSCDKSFDYCIILYGFRKKYIM